jgi:hypothetical protein
MKNDIGECSLVKHCSHTAAIMPKCNQLTRSNAPKPLKNIREAIKRTFMVELDR